MVEAPKSPKIGETRGIWLPPKPGGLERGSPLKYCIDVLAYSANLPHDPISRWLGFSQNGLYDYFPKGKPFQTGEVGSIIDFFIHPSSF